MQSKVLKLDLEISRLKRELKFKKMEKEIRKKCIRDAKYQKNYRGKLLRNLPQKIKKQVKIKKKNGDKSTIIIYLPQKFFSFSVMTYLDCDYWDWKDDIEEIIDEWRKSLLLPSLNFRIHLLKSCEQSYYKLELCGF